MRNLNDENATPTPPEQDASNMLDEGEGAGTDSADSSGPQKKGEELEKDAAEMASHEAVLNAIDHVKELVVGPVQELVKHAEKLEKTAEYAAKTLQMGN